MSGMARYGRQIVLPEFGVNGQQLLRDSAALVVGVGGLGCAASQYLAAAGIGRLTVIDRDRVELSNLQRQVLYTQDDVGRPKAEAARDRLLALNGDVEVVARVEAAAAGSLEVRLRDTDIVLDCSDNFPTRFAVNAACVAARKPLVSGAAIRFEAQLALFDSARGGPCYACLYADTGEAQERCEDAGVLGPVVGVIGSMQALLAMRRLVGLGDDAGRLQLWDAARLTWRTLSVSRDTNCAVCGRAG